MKKIAVFTSHVYEQMSGQMQKGLIDAARKYGVKLIFFASFGDSYSSRNYGKFSRYDEGDCVSFDIPDLNDFDGNLGSADETSAFLHSYEARTAVIKTVTDTVKAVEWLSVFSDTI